MKKIFFAVLGLTASTVYGSFTKCTETCGLNLGKCLLSTFDVEDCFEDAVECALPCIIELDFDKSIHKKTDRKGHKVRQEPLECQRQCGVAYS